MNNISKRSVVAESPVPDPVASPVGKAQSSRERSTIAFPIDRKREMTLLRADRMLKGPREGESSQWRASASTQSGEGGFRLRENCRVPSKCRDGVILSRPRANRNARGN